MTRIGFSLSLSENNLSISLPELMHPKVKATYGGDVILGYHNNSIATVLIQKRLSMRMTRLIGWRQLTSNAKRPSTLRVHLFVLFDRRVFRRWHLVRCPPPMSRRIIFTCSHTPNPRHSGYLGVFAHIVLPSTTKNICIVNDGGSILISSSGEVSTPLQYT